MSAWLFVPGSSPGRFGRAAASGATEVVLDLEDAVGPDDVRRVLAALGHRRTSSPGVLALVESARGVLAAPALAAELGVTHLGLGTVDYALDIGAEEEPETLAHPRSVLVVASRAARIAAPVDGVTTAVHDEAVVAADADRARRLGLGAKLCIHPAQVPVVLRAFAPAEADLARARDLLAAAAEHPDGAAFAHEGRMVDAPVLARARTLLERAAR